jgi:hypothetical protein
MKNAPLKQGSPRPPGQGAYKWCAFTTRSARRAQRLPGEGGAWWGPDRKAESAPIMRLSVVAEQRMKYSYAPGDEKDQNVLHGRLSAPAS